MAIGDEVGLWIPSADSTGNGTSTLYDYSGNDNHITLYNSPTWSSDTTSGGVRCLSFDGTNQYGQGSLYNAVSDQVFSLAFWMRADTMVTNRYFLSLGNSANNTPYIGFYPNSTPSLRVYYRDDDEDFPASSSDLLHNITDSTWYHVYLEADGTNCRMYVDGSLVNVLDRSTLSDGPLTLDQITIGANGRISPSNYSATSLDSIHLFDRVLTGAEIAYLASARLRDDITASGGASASGSADVAVTSNITATGGVAAAGAAVVAVTAISNITASGGACGSGSADVAATSNITATGGVAAAGAAVVAVTATSNITASGGACASGSADVAATSSITATGGVEAAGAAVVNVNSTADIITSGGMSCSGSALITSIVYLTGSGGVVCAGRANNNNSAYPNGFAFRRAITISPTDYQIANFILGVNATLDPGNVYTGTDFQVEDTSGNRKYHELRSYDESTGKVCLFFKTDLTDSSSDYYLYYGGS